MKYLSVVILLMLAGCSSGVLMSYEERQVNNLMHRHMKMAGMELVPLIRKGRYGQVLEGLEAKYQKALVNISQEKVFALELSSLYYVIGNISENIDQMIAQYPEHHLAYLIRGIYLDELAWRVRGAQPANEIPRDRIEKMLELHQKALADLQKSISLDSENYAALVIIAQIYGARSNTAEQSETYFTKAYDLQPASRFLWSTWLYRSTPRWGGSYTLMEERIATMMTHVNQNGSLAVLQNMVLLDQADSALGNKRADIAQLLLKDALSYGDSARVLMLLAEYDLKNNNLHAACSKARRAIIKAPYNWRYNELVLHCNKSNGNFL
ncbi:MAG: DUF4034 domain-containing protein [Pseudomonadales bacterium]|nr:DUF4034 domain-containing protein [Pseudomonadales bacterium]